MKVFQHKRIGGLRITRSALRHYSLYRRAALGGSATMQDLEDFHVYESTGTLTDGINTFSDFSKKNAFANGKWIWCLTQDQIIKSIIDGDACKAEFMSNFALRKMFGYAPFEWRFSASDWFTTKIVESMSNSHPFLPYTK